MTAMTYLQDESTRMTESTTYHTLLVPVQNKLLRAGCSIRMKLNDTLTQTPTHSIWKSEHRCIKNRIAYEWITICATTDNNKLFDDDAKESMLKILTYATKDEDMHKVFIVAQTRILKHGEHGIISLRMTPNYRHLEEQIVRMIELSKD
jgi:hypothetical protein